MGATDPRFDGNAELKATSEQGGWFVFEHLARISGQGTATPYVSSNPSDTLQQHYSRFLGIGTHYGLDIFVEVGADTPTAFTSSVYGSAARFRTEVQGTFTTGGGGMGMEAEAILGANATPNGALFGGQFYLRADAATRTLSRTYACLSLKSNIGAGNAWGSSLFTNAFIRAGDSGSVKLENFLFWNQAAAANSAVRALTAGGNAAMCIAVSINSVQYFIPLSASAT